MYTDQFYHYHATAATVTWCGGVEVKDPYVLTGRDGSAGGQPSLMQIGGVHGPVLQFIPRYRCCCETA